MATLPKTLLFPARTLVGVGSVDQLLTECAGFGPRGVLVHGRSLERSGVLEHLLSKTPKGLDVCTWQHPGGEPTLRQLETLIVFARARSPGWVAGVGGGSVLDIAKACAGLLEAPLDVTAYHDGAPLPPSRLPFLAVPTTAGTGSEATIVSVLTNEDSGVKKSIRHPSYLARRVVLDATLLAGCPTAVIAASGMDAFTQAVESFISTGATWFTERLSLRAVELIADALVDVAQGDPEKAPDLLEGSYLAGLALSHARLGVVHGLAHPLGARFHLPHGLVCAVCLPIALEFNRSHIAAKREPLNCAVGGDITQRSRELLEVLGIQSPFTGRPVSDQDRVIEEVLASGSTAANPRPVTAADVKALLETISL